MGEETSHSPVTTDQSGRNPTQKRRLKERLDVSEPVLEDAISLYREFLDADVDIHYEETLPIAVLYIAVRQHGTPRQIDEMAAAAEVNPRHLYRAARLVSDTLDQGIPPTEPEIYVVRLADTFELCPDAEAATLDVLSEAKTRGYHIGRKPAGLAAAALYTVTSCEDSYPDVTQRELSRETGVYIRTIRQSYHRMRTFVEVE